MRAHPHTKCNHSFSVLFLCLAERLKAISDVTTNIGRPIGGQGRGTYFKPMEMKPVGIIVKSVRRRHLSFLADAGGMQTATFINYLIITLRL